MQLFAAMVMTLITVAVADGLVRVMDIVVLLKANISSEPASTNSGSKPATTNSGMDKQLAEAKRERAWRPQSATRRRAETAPRRRKKAFDPKSFKHRRPKAPYSSFS
jgi:hypothetical protein